MLSELLSSGPVLDSPCIERLSGAVDPCAVLRQMPPVVLGQDAVETARRYLEHLRLSYQAFLIQPFSENLTSQVVKTPKIFWAVPSARLFS